MMKPKISTKGIRIIWDMDIFQKYNRRVTTWVFCTRKMMNKTANTAAQINFGFFTGPPFYVRGFYIDT